jgi:hypothetical protein
LGKAEKKYIMYNKKNFKAIPPSKEQTIRAPSARQPPDTKKTSFDPEEFLNEWVFVFAKGIATAILSNKKAIEKWVNENKKKNESRSFPDLVTSVPGQGKSRAR